MAVSIQAESLGAETPWTYICQCPPALPFTAADVSDISQTHALLHGEEKTVQADAGYIGLAQRTEIIARHGGVEWRIGRQARPEQGAARELGEGSDAGL